MNSLLSSRALPTLLSVVVPIYNEAESLEELRNSLNDWQKTLQVAVEIVLVDDGSIDGSDLYLKSWANDEKNLKVILLSRNFGHQIALTAGLEATSGDAIVIIDADLQDPLEVIHQMIDQYMIGYDVVYGKRADRGGEGFLKKATAWGYYRILKLMANQDIPVDVGDFRLVSRRCLDSLIQLKETHRFIRGMFAWVGFSQTSVLYHRQPRKYGRTKYSPLKMFQFAANGILSFSTFPIRLISLLGLLISTFGGCYGLYSIYRWYNGDTVAGWPTIIILLCMMGGMILISLGIIGEYVARIYEETKRRPLYIVKERI